MNPNIMVYVAMFGWIPLCLALFAFLPGRRACIWAFLIGWLFLPEAAFRLKGFTAYDKMSATCGMVLISALIFDSPTVFRFRPRFWDLPVLVWCICPIFSSDNNGLGFYDGSAAAAYQTIDWGLPYLIGRIYFSDLAGLRELAWGMIVGGLIYVPLCLYEIRMSPQLHNMVYGYHQYEFGQSKRGLTYRPMVFLQTGLAVGMWMAAAALAAFWVWCSKLISRIGGMPIWAATGFLIITAIGCRSIGAIALLAIGIGVLLLTRYTRWNVWLVALSLLAPAYMIVRGANLWDGKDLVKRINESDPRSAQSLRLRLQSERVIVDHAMKQPWFGWGGWDRFRARDEEGNDIGTPDGMWIIAIGHNGLVGLISFTLMLNLPVVLLLRRIPARLWGHPGAAPAAALAVISALYMCDCLMNAMLNPIFMLGVGGICGLTVNVRQPLALAEPVPTRPSAPPDPPPALPSHARSGN